jgi:hypothetical protein
MIIVQKGNARLPETIESLLDEARAQQNRVKPAD